MPKRYQVVVGNIGNVCDTFIKKEALRTYNEYVELSRTGQGRGAAEDVTLFEGDSAILSFDIEEYADYKIRQTYGFPAA